MRLSKVFYHNDTNIQQRLLKWAAKQSTCCVLNSNCNDMLFADAYASHEFIVAVDSVEDIKVKARRDSFEELKKAHKRSKDWLFGYFSYDLKNETESLSSENFDGLDFEPMYFFRPRLILKFTKNKVEVLYLRGLDSQKTVQHIFEEICETNLTKNDFLKIKVKPRVSKKEYISTVNKIRQHIQRGDIYEMNYCVEFYAKDVSIKPETIYATLNELSPMPFSSFFKRGRHYVMCASPERFITKCENKIISQPIKGTARRGKTAEEDKLIRIELKNDPKEQSENVMIVDLVRNDLSRTAKKGSVKVEELFGIYTFEQLHQMISTVVSQKKVGMHFTNVIKHAFPMGSMTGAPKVRAMQLIEDYEKTKRGLYSGSVGYITPAGDFDFNVVIRSILYNATNKYLSFMVGSAITANANAEKEYKECLLKANAMLKVLNPNPKKKNT